MPPGVHTDDEVEVLARPARLGRRRRLGGRGSAASRSATPGSPRPGSTTSTSLPRHGGRGVGTALLDLVKAQRPAGFCLWVFETNAPARGFYARRGLVELERTDGSGNEEQAPDVRMAWPGAEPARLPAHA